MPSVTDSNLSAPSPPGVPDADEWTASTDRPTRTPRRLAPSWVALLCVGAAMVPLAAVGAGADRDTIASAISLIAPASSGGTPTAVDRGQALSRNLAEEPARTPPVRWRHSVSHGTPNAGSLSGGVLLPAVGVGFYTYNPATQETPGGGDRQWGNALLVRNLLRLTEWWATAHPNAPRLGIGDLSQRNGGYFPGPGIGHASHQNGLDVDIRLPRRDGVEGPANETNYDRALTRQLVDRLVSQGAQLVLVGDAIDVPRGGVVMTWPAHNDHVHARFPNPG